jgi:hypothetical protein
MRCLLTRCWQSASVRARPGECLIGIGGAEGGLFVNASVDASTMDMSLVQLWKEKLEHMLDEGLKDDRSKL